MMRIYLLITALFSLNGCLVAGITAGAAGAGYVVQNEYQKSSEKRATAQDKEDIFAEAKARQELIEQRAKVEEINDKIRNIINHSYITGGLTRVINIDTKTENGVVTLTGVVPSQALADRAVILARRTPGVKTVVSKMMIIEAQIDVPPGSRPKPHGLRPVPSITNLPKKQFPPGFAPSQPGGAGAAASAAPERTKEAEEPGFFGRMWQRMNDVVTMPE